MELRFYHDKESEQPHILNHGVTQAEVRQIIANPGEDRPAADNSRMAMGQTEFGRYLRVIYVRDPGNYSIFVITAYELTGKQKQAYRRRRRKRDK